MRFHVTPNLVLEKPAWQDCVCGEQRADWNDSGTRRYYPCCDRVYLDGKLVAIGMVWLDRPMRPKTPPTAQQLLEIAASCPTPPDGMTTALYRRFDSEDLLLYVGVSDGLRTRSKWHERHSPWTPFVARRTTEWFASRAEAEAAEKAAIKAEGPLFNKQHALPEQRKKAAEYLMARGRMALVEPAPIEEDQK
jgi:hypothetical protein